MKILHITSHLGGGLGTVILSWMEKVQGHTVLCLDTANTKARRAAETIPFNLADNMLTWPGHPIERHIAKADIVIVHWYDHPMLAEFFARQLPASRLVFWSHKNYDVPANAVSYPDRFIDVSPVQGHGAYIWSTGNMDKYLNLPRREHPDFNVGYVGTIDYKKLHDRFFAMCETVDIPNVRFTVVGEDMVGGYSDERFTFIGAVPEVAPFLEEMDVFGYPLRPDHYGTCEQVLGEAMAAGVVPVVMDNPAERLIIEDGVNGFIAKTEKEYVACIEFLYKYPAIREHLAFNARQRASKLYSIDNMVRQWEAVFEDMMKEPKKERRPL